MALDRVALGAFGISCDRCRSAAPTVVLRSAEEDEVQYYGPLEAIECATRRGFDLSFRMELRCVVVTRSLCPCCARLLVN